MRIKTIYICENCRFESPKWVGKCPDCDAWNSFHEDAIATGKAKREHQGIVQKPELLANTKTPEKRLQTNIKELDRVIGGGIVAGSVTLLSGEPGIGKSTLTLDLCANLAKQNVHVLYISGEESPHQIGMRAKRMKVEGDNLSILGENSLENILKTVQEDKPDFLVIDSIQAISSYEIPSLAGSMSQVRYCTESLLKFGKENNVPVLIIGHVNKEGNLAGPKMLEHLVDTVLLIEGDRFQNLRIVRCQKNRFGSTNEIGLFEMIEDGLVEIANASELLLEGRKKDAFGSAITTTLEGTRPLLLEVQALTNTTPFGYPKRAASGFDTNRLQLLLAVIQKHLKFSVNEQDVYINVVGGLRLSDPAADSAIVMAVISSLTKKPLPSDAVFLGEIGLSGEFRATSQLAKRIKEAEKIGFKTAYVPVTKEKIATKGLKLQPVEDLQKLLQLLDLTSMGKRTGP